MPSFEAWPSYADKYAPLEDVKKAEVHFRASKAKVLRSLGASSYRNGSQFAMVWVSPAGEVDAYASVALQPKLQLWLGKRVQADAQDAVKQWRTDRDLRYRSGERDATTDAKAAPEYSGVYGTEGAIFRPDDDDDNDDDDDDDDMMGDRDGGGDCDARKPVASTSARPRSAEPVLAASSTTRHRSTRSINDARQQHTSPALSSHSATTSPNLAAASSNLVARQQHKPVKAAPMTREDLDHWFSTKISNLSHKTDKIVCRSWIKVIDPHKQTKFPYQKGEEAKPSWWPRNIRHKEPDHLGKQERIGLLLHLLRLPQVSIAQLEAATGAVQTQIPPHKLLILQNIYEFAKCERSAMEASPSGHYEFVIIDLLERDRQRSMYADFEAGDEGDRTAPPTLSPQLAAAETRTARPQRTRTKNTIGSPHAATENVATTTTTTMMMQQTPRAARAAPYPLARSASATNELSNLSLNNATSPSLGHHHSPASTSLSRSQSHVGLNSAARAPRLNGRASVGEGDLLTTPYQGGRVRTNMTPRQQAAAAAGQGGSPLSSSMMGRSASTSAIGAKTMMDEAVASPAMIKSRSKLSQKCFDQMTTTENAGSEFERFPPQPQFTMIHPHHLQTMLPHPEGFPPPPSIAATTPQHGQPLPHHPHNHNHPHVHQPHHPQVQVQVQVHAGHGLALAPHHAPPGYGYTTHHNPHHLATTQQFYGNSPASDAAPHHFSSPNPQQQSLQFVAPNGLTYEHATTLPPHQVVPVSSGGGGEEAFGGGGGGTPSLSGFINSPELSHEQQQQTFDPVMQGLHHDGLAAAAAGDGGGTSTSSNQGDPFDPNNYLAASSRFTTTSPHLHHHPHQHHHHHHAGDDSADDLGAYVRQLEGFELQQQGSSSSSSLSAPYDQVGLGFVEPATTTTTTTTTRHHHHDHHHLSSTFAVPSGNDEYYY